MVALAVLAAAVLALGSHGLTIRKSLAAERGAIDRAWADVDAALNQRADLVPELVNTVRQEAPDESPKILAVKEASTSLAAARGPREKIQANARLDNAIGDLMLLAENYPGLARGKKFAGVLDGLKEAEFQIAVTRRKYNEAVEHYNTRIALFPNNLVAALSGFGKIDAYFQTPAI